MCAKNHRPHWCSCPSEVVYQRLTDLNGHVDSRQEQQALDVGAANTAEVVGFSYLLSVSVLGCWTSLCSRFSGFVPES